MTIRLIALDLDGTLLNSQREISPASLAALSEAVEKGIHILITTGRRSYSARPLIRSLPFPTTLAASNGALVASNQGDIIHRNFLPQQIAVEVLEIAHTCLSFTVAIFDLPGRGQVVMQNDALPSGPLNWYLTNAPECLVQVPDLPAAISSDPIHIMFGGPPALLQPIEEILLSSRLARKIHLSWTRYDSRNIAILDVMNRGCSKGQALRWWARQCGIEASEVMAIGDNFNDLEMLEFAGVPVVMANAPPGLARDHWRRTLSNDEDGVAAAVRSLALKGNQFPAPPK